MADNSNMDIVKDSEEYFEGDNSPDFNKIKSLKILLPILMLAVLTLGGLYHFYPQLFYLQKQSSIQVTQKPTPFTPATAYASTEGIVTVTNKGFLPTTIRVIQGSSITFTNFDVSSHQIISDSNPNTYYYFDGGDLLSPTDSFTITFEKTGTYSYHDSVNPTFKGSVIVTE